MKKVAIVHDELARKGGAERVVLTFLKAFPQAEVYTLVYHAEKTYKEYKKYTIIQSWYKYVAKSERLLRWLFFPFGMFAMRSIFIEDADFVLISTTHAGKYVRVKKGIPVFTYCYTPFRIVWNPESYGVYKNANPLIKLTFNLVLNVIKRFDIKYARRTNHWIAMTQETKERLLKAYNPLGEIEIINPSIDISKFRLSHDSGDYYLLVSRFEPYKKVDLAIKSFNQLGEKLIIVGKGSQKESLMEMANQNIEFKEDISDIELSGLYEKAKAFIFPQKEDYGLTPIEANACGKPVIAFAEGGVNDTMIPFTDHNQKCTAVFFNEQKEESLTEAILFSKSIEFDPEFIRSNAEKFHENYFIMRLQQVIKNKLKIE